jgi:carboxyl-terminal processing protease
MLADNAGYIQVDSFPEGESQEIATRIRDLQKQGAKKIVLDLRNAAGGAESEGIATANLFLDHGTITYLQGQKYPRQAFNADPAKDITKLPVAVLVNRGTAGPAEIVASAILENARGDVVGDKTFGGQLRPDSFDRQILLAGWKSNSGCVGHAERPGR